MLLAKQSIAGLTNKISQWRIQLAWKNQIHIAGSRNVGGTMLALALANVDSPQNAIKKLQSLANQRLKFP